MARCVECGSEFFAKHRGHVLCSDRCAHRRWVARGRRPAELEFAACDFCSALFVRANPKRRYCREKCRDDASGRRQWQRGGRDKEAARRRCREWARRNRDKMRAREKEWARLHPDALRRRQHRRRARERGATGDWTPDEWAHLVASYGGTCAYCGRRTTLLTVDHRVPLFRGGANSIDNILPACSLCNKRKGYRDEEEFRAEIASERSSTSALSTSLRQSEGAGRRDVESGGRP
jgi:hypothetical protein